MLIQFLRFFFAKFRVTGALVIGGIFGLIVGVMIFGKAFPLLVLFCIFLSTGLLLTDSWWHSLFRK